METESSLSILKDINVKFEIDLKIEWTVQKLHFILYMSGQE